MNKLLPGWRPVGGPGLSGPVPCGRNGLLEGRVPLCWAQIQSMWKIVKIAGVSSSWRCPRSLRQVHGPRRAWVLAYLEKCCCSVTICRPPHRDVAPSLLSAPRCRLTSGCRLVRSWISVVGVAAGKDNSFPVNPTGWNPSEGLRRCRTSVRRFCWLSWTEDHRQAFNLPSTVGCPGEAFMEARVLDHLIMWPHAKSVPDVTDPLGHRMSDLWSLIS